MPDVAIEVFPLVGKVRLIDQGSGLFLVCPNFWCIRPRLKLPLAMYLAPPLRNAYNSWHWERAEFHHTPNAGKLQSKCLLFHACRFWSISELNFNWNCKGSSLEMHFLRAFGVSSGPTCKQCTTGNAWSPPDLFSAKLRNTSHQMTTHKDRLIR